ncbi:thioredoxin fold domain-containing protein [Thermovibrio sp.]
MVIEGILLKVPQVVIEEKDREKLIKRALFKVGKGEPLIVLTNPLCRACSENREKIEELSERFTLIFVPVGFEGEEFEAAVDAYCRKKSAEEFFKVEKPLKVCDWGKLRVWSSQDVLKKYGITATPTFILPDGRALVGIEELLRSLK